MTGGGLEWAVRRLELVDEAEGFVVINAIEKLQGKIAGDIRSVALDPPTLTIVDEFGVEVFALSRMDALVVETTRGLTDVILTHQSGPVAGVAQQFRKCGNIGGQLFHIVGTL